jgi:hypothetical protein
MGKTMDDPRNRAVCPGGVLHAVEGRRDRAIVPFVLVYYVAGLRIPRRVVAIFGVLTISVVTVISTLMAQLRVAISLTYETPDTFNFASAGGWLGLKTNILGLLSRVGSSFDVLALVVLQRFQFLPYRNFSAELYDVVNGYVPGGLFAVDAPRWASALFGIGHDVNYESLLRIGTGENITLPGHLLVYFGVAGSCLVAFTVMLVFTLGYRYSSTVLVKTFLLTSIVFDVTNGSGLISMVLGYPTMMLALFLCYLAYRFLRGALVANTGVRVPPSRRARLATIE